MTEGKKKHINLFTENTKPIQIMDCKKVQRQEQPRRAKMPVCPWNLVLHQSFDLIQLLRDTGKAYHLL